MNKLLFAALALALGRQASGANLLLNPGFESGPAGQTQDISAWTLYGGNAYNETGSAARTGTNYFKVYQAFNGSTNYTGIYQDYISGPGAVYTVDGWAKTISTDTLAGQDVTWIEVSFRDSVGNTLALYRSTLINTNTIATGAFPKNTWVDLPVTNQYNPANFALTNTVHALVAPNGTYFVRVQIVLQGDPAGSNGSVYFDDMNLNLISGSPYGNWNIVWHDEFDGISINSKTWTFESGNNGGWGNNELEYYTSNSSNVHVSNGILHITAQKQSVNNFSFTSARMKTQGLAWWLYGRFEWRAKFPAGTGFWPAIWFLGTNFSSVGWPGCGEMDVTENDGATPVWVQGSLHSGSDETAVYDLLPGDSVTNFHTYVLDWSTNAFLWYVDGRLYEIQSNWSSSIGPHPAPFNKASFMIMNLAVGGNYVNNPSVSAIQTNGGFPGDMQVDYVRVYNATAPIVLSGARTNTNVTLSWPTNIIAHLQVNTNFPNGAWSDVSSSTNPLTVGASNKAAFYRLKSP